MKCGAEGGSDGCGDSLSDSSRADTERGRGAGARPEGSVGGVWGDDASAASCRICFEGSSDAGRAMLSNVCGCSGSLAFVHDSCLSRWRRSRPLMANTRSGFCEVCGYQYKVPMQRMRFQNAREVLAWVISGIKVFLPGSVSCLVILAIALQVVLHVIICWRLSPHFVSDEQGRLHLVWVTDGPKEPGLSEGALLVATHHIGRGLFHRSVILLYEQTDMQWSGLILNKQGVDEAREGIVGWGGPVQRNLALQLIVEDTNQAGVPQGEGWASGAGMCVHEGEESCVADLGPCANGARASDGVCPNTDGTYGPGHWNRSHPEATAWWSRGGKRVLPGTWLRVAEAEKEHQAVGVKPVRSQELLLSGLSRWAPHQLDGEILRGDWWICYADAAEVLSKPPREMWDTLSRDAVELAEARSNLDAGETLSPELLQNNLCARKLVDIGGYEEDEDDFSYEMDSIDMFMMW